MATTTSKTICFLCEKPKVAYSCPGCSKYFCIDHLLQHRREVEQEFDQLQNNHDQIRQQINDIKLDPTKHSLIKQIDQWEKDSIDKIKQQALRCRTQVIQYSNGFLREIEEKLNHLAEQIKDIHVENNFNEIDLNDLKQRLEKLERELNQPADVSIKQHSTLFINKIFLPLPFRKDTRWKQFAITVAGGNGQGDRLDQLNAPRSISVDDHNQMIYIADWNNHRIMEWKLNRGNGRVVAGGNRRGIQLDQLNNPTDVIIDRQNNDLIIVDQGNKRVMRWSCHSNSPPEIIFKDIYCNRLVMHGDGTLYVSDWKKNEVRRWKKGETCGTIVAGGNEQGNQLNQLNNPSYIFIDHDHALYISDFNNHRVMKWVKDAKEGIVIAGGYGQGNRLSQLPYPQGIVVDRSGQIFVADRNNHRVMRWCEGEREGRIVVGGNGKGQEKNQLHEPNGLSFDCEGNLYVADSGNHRIQKFEIDLD